MCCSTTAASALWPGVPSGRLPARIGWNSTRPCRWVWTGAIAAGPAGEHVAFRIGRCRRESHAGAGGVACRAHRTGASGVGAIDSSGIADDVAGPGNRHSEAWLPGGRRRGGTAAEGSSPFGSAEPRRPVISSRGCAEVGSATSIRPRRDVVQGGCLRIEHRLRSSPDRH